MNYWIHVWIKLNQWGLEIILVREEYVLKKVSKIYLTVLVVLLMQIKNKSERVWLLFFIVVLFI